MKLWTILAGSSGLVWVVLANNLWEVANASETPNYLIPSILRAAGALLLFLVVEYEVTRIVQAITYKKETR